jgi:drug/metabolite transporter (DMT)-like permease
MAAAAIVAALSSALIHAIWNALLKRGDDRLADAAFMAAASIVYALTLIAIFGLPADAAWPFIAGSAIAHVGYWTCMFKGYDQGDLSHVYTLARGSAPLLVTLGAAFAASEVPSVGAAAGIFLVCAGVFLVGASPRAPLKATMWALLTGMCIATYSVINGMGVRLAGNPFSYIGPMTLGTFVPFGLFAFARRGPAMLLAHAKRDGLRAGVIGIISSAGFAIALWAQTIAPIAQVTALRETSVVFGALIAFLFLKEHLGARRWGGAALVALGAGLIALG